MRELSLHILDIAENALKANASTVTVHIVADTKSDTLLIRIEDDGCGIPKKLLATAFDPFTTTRTTRPVGLGLPFLRAAAESAGGGVVLSSTEGVGTTVTATFGLSHIDRLPLGDLGSTFMSLVQHAPRIRQVWTVERDGTLYHLDTQEVLDMLDGVPIDDPDMLVALRDLINENTSFMEEI
ncbi:MAG: ATP-binding protein [Clostridiales bacterium]|jgi:hypothetical protein|nr:ATP-binding protein [Clostridiales bacterium]